MKISRHKRKKGLKIVKYEGKYYLPINLFEGQAVLDLLTREIKPVSWDGDPTTYISLDDAISVLTTYLSEEELKTFLEKVINAKAESEDSSSVRRIPVRVSQTGSKKYPLKYIKLPKEVMDILGVDVGDWVVFEIDEDTKEIRLGRV